MPDITYEKLQLKAMSSLEKCFIDDNLADKQEMNNFTIFRNQPLVYQVGLYCEDRIARHYNERGTVQMDGPLAKYANVRTVISVANHHPCMPNADDRYIRRTPGLYPDLLRPLHYDHGLTLMPKYLHSLWIEVNVPDNFPAGSYPLTLSLVSKETDEIFGSVTVTVRVLDMALPPQTLIHTEWFYTDCIAVHYRVRPFSEKHWKLIEKFLRTASKNGINMIMTPVFTPALDTYIGGERPTTQLLDITVEGKNRYSFGFDKLDRWIDLCHSLGITYFEVPHFFTQWGAKHAPKFIGTVNGRKKKIFGWHTDACGEEYNEFLKQMIPALVEHLEKRGVAEQTYFHISDEPRLKDMEQYLRCKNAIEPLVKGYPIIDALSNYEFYESGASKKPIPGICHIQPFLDHHVPDLWAYYCGNSGTNVSGRMLAMPLSRTRILGVQLWLYHIVGFLHWGYNFYYNENSHDYLNPFLHTEGEYFESSGDTFIVYPGDDETPWESIRLNALREAMEDMRLLQLCEARIGREATEAIVRESAGATLTFTEYPRETNYLYDLRERLIAAIENA